MAISVDPDKMPHSAASDLGLNYMYLLRPDCPNTKSKYGNLIKLIAPPQDISTLLLNNSGSTLVLLVKRQTHYKRKKKNRKNLVEVYVTPVYKNEQAPEEWELSSLFSLMS